MTTPVIERGPYYLDVRIAGTEYSYLSSLVCAGAASFELVQSTHYCTGLGCREPRWDQLYHPV